MSALDRLVSSTEAYTEKNRQDTRWERRGASGGDNAAEKREQKGAAKSRPKNSCRCGSLEHSNSSVLIALM